MLNFEFFRKGSGNSFSITFYGRFSGIVLLTDQNSLPDYLYFVGDAGDNMCIAIVNFPDCDVINFEINPIFLIKPFL